MTYIIVFSILSQGVRVYKKGGISQIATIEIILQQLRNMLFHDRISDDFLTIVVFSRQILRHPGEDLLAVAREVLRYLPGFVAVLIRLSDEQVEVDLDPDCRLGHQGSHCPNPAAVRSLISASLSTTLSQTLIDKYGSYSPDDEEELWDDMDAWSDEKNLPVMLGHHKHEPWKSNEGVDYEMLTTQYPQASIIVSGEEV